MAKDAFNKNGGGSTDPFDDKPAGLDKATQQLAEDIATMTNLKMEENSAGPCGDSDEYIEKQATGVKVESVVAESSLTAGHESNSMMRRAYPVKYDFIPSDEKYLNN